MTDNSLRTAIARALSAQTTCDGEPHPSELHYRQADAVLAVLADLPKSVIERASLAIHEHQYLAGSRECKCFKTFRFKEGQQAHRKHRAEAAFRAAFGGSSRERVDRN